MQRKLFLIIDKSELARMLIRQIVEHVAPNVMVLEAENAKEALEAAGDNKLHMICLSHSLSPSKSFTLADKLKTKHPNARYGLLVIKADDIIRARCKETGMRLIEKPISEKNIYSFILGRRIKRMVKSKHKAQPNKIASNHRKAS